jgi:hypothetical protein
MGKRARIIAVQRSKYLEEKYAALEDLEIGEIVYLSNRRPGRNGNAECRAVARELEYTTVDDPLIGLHVEFEKGEGI